MHDTIETVVAILGIVLFGLFLLARRFPNVEWLQHFRYDVGMSKERQARMHRRTNVLAGMKLILLGLVVPPGYLVFEVMTFSSISKTEFAIVLAGSVLCIGLGITAIVHRPR